MIPLSLLFPEQSPIIIPGNDQPPPSPFILLCEKCQKSIDSELLQWAVMLYGAYFLDGTSDCYVGITCPNCLKTILLEGDKSLLLPAKQKLFPDMVDLFGYNFKPKWGYHSPIGIFKIARKNGILHNSVRLEPDLNLGTIEILSSLRNLMDPADNIDPEDSLTDFNELGGPFDEIKNSDEAINITDYDRLKDPLGSRNYAGPDYYLTYSERLGDPFGSIYTVLAFRGYELDKLIKLEDQGTRVFPRIVYRNPVIEEIERFYCDHCIDHETLIILGAPEKDDDSPESEKRYQEEWEKTQQRAEKYQEVREDGKNTTETRMSVRFLDILKSDPSLGRMRTPATDFWKTINPLADKSQSAFPNGFDLDSLNDNEASQTHYEQISMIQNNPKKKHVRDSTLNIIDEFYESYIDLTTKWPFTWAHVWELKESFLVKLYENIKVRTDKGSEWQCVEFALKIWAKEPHLQTSELVERKDFDNFCKINKISYEPKTYEKWLRGHCPNPRRGRKPGSKNVIPK